MGSHRNQHDLFHHQAVMNQNAELMSESNKFGRAVPTLSL